MVASCMSSIGQGSVAQPVGWPDTLSSDRRGQNYVDSVDTVNIEVCCFQPDIVIESISDVLQKIYRAG